MMMMVRFNTGNHFRIYSSQSHFHSKSQSQSGFYSIFVNSANRVVANPQLFLDSVREQCRSGFSSIDVPVSIFHQLNSLCPRPSIIVFTKLFTAMSKIQPNPPFSTVITLSNHLELSGLRPDSHSIGILAKCYCSLGRLDFAFSLLGRNLKLGYPPNIVFVTTLFNGLVDSHKVDQAVNLLDKTVKLGIQPSLVNYSSMFKGLCRSDDSAGTLRLLQHMESTAPFKPNVVIYNTIIHTLCKNKLLPQALSLFKEMTTKNISPNVITYTNLIRGLFSLGHWNHAKVLWTEMLANNIAPNVHTYNILVDMYCKEGNVHEARAIFGLMSKRGVHPTFLLTLLCWMGTVFAERWMRQKSSLISW
ncbi:uncharacterized protein LOC141611471 isoform X1 [Silene latifolia]|uniref:uncharacterized protein LOC141611471 isoform X1 n=1 Tax=Silene latifolia TaxID=37657 RepID=UPI003D76AD0F